MCINQLGITIIIFKNCIITFIILFYIQKNQYFWGINSKLLIVTKWFNRENKVNFV